VLSSLDDVWRLQWREAGVDGAVGGVSHQTVEECPCWTEHPWRWTEWWLLKGHVLVLCVLR
jgi:hypothetical protein